MIKKFMTDMSKYMPAQIVPGIVSFLSLPIITRIFSPAEYGNYSLVMTTVLVFSALLGWISMSVVRFYSSAERDKTIINFNSNIILLTLISAVIISVVYLLLLLFFRRLFSKELIFLMYIGLGVIIGNSVFEILQNILRIRGRVGLYSWFASLKSVISIIIVLLLIFLLGTGVEALLYGPILCVLFIFPFLWTTSLNSGFSLKIHIDKKLSKEMISYSIPLVIGNIAAWILNLSDRYILEYFRGSDAVGIYSAGYNIADRSILLIVSLFRLAAGPILIRTWEYEGEKKAKDLVERITRYYLVICTPMVLGLAALSKPIVMIMTGEAFYESYKIIAIIAIGILFLGLQQRYHSGLIFYKNTKIITLAIFISSIFNIILNFIFIPIYGYFAAAITTFLSYLFLLILMIVFSRKYFKFRFPLKSSIKTTISSAIMAIGVYWLSSSLYFSVIVNLAISVLAGIIIYAGLLSLFQEYSEEEMQIIKSIGRKLNIIK